MNKTVKGFILFCVSFFVVAFSFGGERDDKQLFTHKIVAGFNLGATTPVSIPDEIESIKGWWPQFTPQLGYNVIYNSNPVWGIGSGVLLNYKGMGVKDQVKYMYTQVVLEENSDEKLKGYFVGKNKTEIKTAYVTIPLYITYQPFERWKFRIGGYASYLFSGEFKGTVSDGYLRLGSPVGEKVEITEASFTFMEELRTFDFGLTIGSEGQINNRFGVYANLDWGLTPIFPSDFEAVEFKMYNIYLTLGLSYRL